MDLPAGTDKRQPSCLYFRSRGRHESRKAACGTQGRASGEGLVGIGRSFGDGTGWSGGEPAMQATGALAAACRLERWGWACGDRDGSPGLRGCTLPEHWRRRAVAGWSAGEVAEVMVMAEADVVDADGGRRTVGRRCGGGNDGG
jgi:hypothetical protein